MKTKMKTGALRLTDTAALVVVGRGLERITADKAMRA